MQREVPEEINIAACKIARKHNVLTVLDVGGVDQPITDELLSLLDIISPNKTELKRITGKEVDLSNESELINVIEELRKKSNNKNLEILLKLGSKGAAHLDKDNKIYHQGAFHFDDLPILDTTGAGKYIKIIQLYFFILFYFDFLKFFRRLLYCVLCFATGSK